MAGWTRNFRSRFVPMSLHGALSSQDTGRGIDPSRAAKTARSRGDLAGLQTGILLHEVTRLRRGIFRRMAEPLGISQHQWWVLACLILKNGMVQTEIAEQLGLGKASVGELIDKLERDGWVVRRGDAHDRRAKCIYLTGDARRMIDKIWTTEKQFGDKLFAGIKKEDRAHFLRTLAQMKSNLLSELA